MEKHANQNPAPSVGKTVIYQISKILKGYFGNLTQNFNALPDPRLIHQYGIDEIAMGGIALFLFKERNRNNFNLDRKDPVFLHNYKELFQMDLPHMDTVRDVFCDMETSGFEQLKANMVSSLIRKKVLYPYRFMGKFIVAIDGSGIVSFDERHCDACLTKTSKKNEKTTYFHNVLEAKLVTHSGLCISIASEWINNEGKNTYDKQDCERNAFTRLAEKLKHFFPRLPMIITADGLYPYQGFFEICNQNNWNYIVTLQDGNLKSLQEDIRWEKIINHKQKINNYLPHKNNIITQEIQWLNGLKYHDYELNWVSCLEVDKNTKNNDCKINRFVHLTDLKMDKENCLKISNAGRLRHKIENEGFNNQKNHGYNLSHKYVRVNFNAMKNFYQCLQIAHMINQLVELSSEIVTLLKSDSNLTIAYLWKRLLTFLLENQILENQLAELTKNPYQIRLC